LDKKHLNVLGTIGGGNHFAEFQEVEQVYDQEAFDELALDQNDVFMLVHSGSRSLGESILQRYLEEVKNGGASQELSRGAPETSQELQNYLRAHDIALNFARRNRFLIAHRILEQIDSRRSTTAPDQKYAVKDTDCIIDIFHNFVERQAVKFGEEEQDKEGRTEMYWIHRKGATPSNHS
jgi:release factor H-coupled RctB family protein